MDQHHLRSIILKLENRLSDDDRKRLHFFLGNDVPRRIRDDPSLGGTLNLIESLFDQDKINEQDFTFLIHAFDEIQCMDAVKLLREHMRQIQTGGIQQSTQTLNSLMPCTIEDVDKYTFQTALLDEEYTYNDINDRNEINNVLDVNESHLQTNEKQSSKRSYLFIFIFLLIIILALLIFTTIIFIDFIQLKKDCQIKEKNFVEEQVKNVQLITNQTIQDLFNRLQQSINEQRRQNMTIEQLNNQIWKQHEEHLNNSRINGELFEKLLQSFDEQRKQNETIEKLINQCRSRSPPTIKSVITTTTTEYRPSTSQGQPCGCPITSTCRENCISLFDATDGRCSGFLDLICECYIAGIWQSKASRC